MEHFLESSNDFLLMSKLIKKYMDDFPKVYLKENQVADEKRLRRLVAKFDDTLLEKIGYKVEKKGNKSRYTFSEVKKNMDEDDCNTLTDILSLAEVSKNFHYGQDIPKLKKTLANTFDIEGEPYEIYVGHNNYGNDKASSNHKKLLMIKEIIKEHNLLNFQIKYNEENEYNTKLLLEANTTSANGDTDLYRKLTHEMKPYLIIHDSDETFILFKRNNFIEKELPMEQSYFVSLANIVYSSMSVIKNTKKGIHKIDIKNIKYTIPSRKHIKMKVSTKIGYILETRQGDYKVINRDKNYMLIEFSEIYHALNFVFMHDGPENLFRGFYHDEENKDILEKWNAKVGKFKHEGN